MQKLSVVQLIGLWRALGKEDITYVTERHGKGTSLVREL